ncbi:MAG: metallophosphoesterase, partial [bacterium]
MTSITWLHISDLHVCHPKYGTNHQEVTEKLVEDLRRLKEEHGLFADMIFFTGDAAFGQIEEEEGKSLPVQYAKANRFLESIRTTYGEDFPKSNIFIVPGNHDINLAVDNKSLFLWLREKADLRKLTDMIHDPNSLWRSYVTKLREYEEFLKDYGYDHLLDDPSRAIYSDIREFSRIKIGIAGFNSAWSSSGKGQREKGKLWLDGERQLASFRQNLKRANFCIALMHHPIYWFTKKEDLFLKQKMAAEFKFLLHGHDHKNWVTQINEHTRIAAGNCYHNPDKKAGYNIVRLNLDEGKGEVWLREYDPSGPGEWVPCQLGDGQTDHLGRYHLKHMIWLKDLKDTLSIGASIEDGAQTRSKIFVIPSTSERAYLDKGQTKPFLPPRLIQKFYETINNMDRTELHEEAFQGGPSRIRDLFLPKEDIDFEIIQAKTTDGIPLKEKEPSLQELRTETQIRKHFIPLPKITRHMDEWISNEKDVLFFGPPFCGKTSLLAYLSLEANRLYGDQMPIVRLKINKDLNTEDVEGAVARLLQQLDYIGIHKKEKRAVLVVDNIHEPRIFAITKELMRSPRQWRVWGASRCADFQHIFYKDEENPWRKKGIIKNACDLLDDEDCDYFVDHVLSHLLVANGKEDQIKGVRAAIKSIGRVPIRFLCQVWGLINCLGPETDHDFIRLIGKLPIETDEIVRSILPQSIPGLRALAIAEFLKGPSWELLSYILSKVEGFGEDLAASTINQMKEYMALLDDPEEPNKVFIYAPVQ